MKTKPPPCPTLTVAFMLPGTGVGVGLPPGMGVAVGARGTGVIVGFGPVTLLLLLLHLTVVAVAAIRKIGPINASQRRLARFSFIGTSLSLAGEPSQWRSPFPSPNEVRAAKSGFEKGLTA